MSATATAAALRGDASALDYTQHLEESAASLAKVRQLVAEKLAPKVVDVDLKAEYPEAFLRELGAAGGFRGAVAPEYGGNGLGLKHVVQVMEEAARHCLSTGFLVWCQTACARYIQMSDNEALKTSMLPRIARGDVLVGTGLSNTVKSCDTIEDFRLSARKVAGGYLINGVLPWVPISARRTISPPAVRSRARRRAMTAWFSFWSTASNRASSWSIARTSWRSTEPARWPATSGTPSSPMRWCCRIPGSPGNM